MSEHTSSEGGRDGADLEQVTDASAAATAEKPGWTPTRRQFVGVAGGAAGGLALSGVLTGSSSEAETAPPEETTISVTINGKRQQVSVDSRTSLLDMLRERIGLTGTKKGCNQGACGACTVLVNGRRIVSCLTLAVMHEGAELTTVEGLAQNGRLHPLQQAFIDRDAFQCGFCTSGQIVSGVGCIREGHTGSPEEIREWMSGNICRCGAYPNIVAAVAQTAKAR
ncbi:(2Fe-2S)-binding protein [Amycolatopsis sp. H20-H5]|uniref:(2Fe-2S)-binding protein n=1 Tax=Amycolatopsis sp. H20-H5 TaxID=3046309 RepID=UPI002DBB4803|nr:(2Fe-2S)-binding protein [Amycolatopsis sp. H20-H5]MEC3975763.1 (2Fe-2S)-binding protein [Amycolatopsis sp. H20-H5]